MSGENGKRRKGERGEGREYSSRQEAGGGAVLCGVWKGQLDSLQAAIAQDFTQHARHLRRTLRHEWRFEFHYRAADLPIN